MEIAPGIDASEWRALDLTSGDSPDWPTAIGMLRKRIEARYLEPVDILVATDENRSPSSRRFGFTIAAIDCLLVETLEAFIEGRTDTAGDSEKVFIRFLTSRESFKTYFDAPLARRFYKEIRCGILHQAETTGNTRIRSIGDLVQLDGDRLTVNRSKFHSLLKDEFGGYLDDLANSHNHELRSKFKFKMDYVCKL